MPSAENQAAAGVCPRRPLVLPGEITGSGSRPGGYAHTAGSGVTGGHV